MGATATAETAWTGTQYGRPRAVARSRGGSKAKEPARRWRAYVAAMVAYSDTPPDEAHDRAFAENRRDLAVAALRFAHRLPLEEPVTLDPDALRGRLWARVVGIAHLYADALALGYPLATVHVFAHRARKRAERWARSARVAERWDSPARALRRRDTRPACAALAAKRAGAAAGVAA